ncbi:DUF2567 domain-containing protein [Saccharothrix coeruleofusca]|uniref:DUF2567 domain-containing protein n=1 Tax=Saccharothrix coeruleofusca TaxID=33919 RepID=A0A918EE21_9PSEU|nr:DUF2567 domain-containing protein [Saccharothrix coeruleofusca]MBP2338332.1 hypothetical protein [Saccharothrix coeruleofusca]GGP49062.1 hypothetical protein GCM10010185_21530 [Saccharothrix coeruleofusca]
MAEQPVGGQQPPVEAAPAGTFPEAPEVFAYYYVPPRPRVVVRRDLLPAFGVLSTVALFGLPTGWLWAWLAPAQNVVVQQDSALIPVTGESYHRLDALMVFVLIGLGAGLLTGIAVWALRERRGPVVMLGAVLGGALAAFLAQRTGIGAAAGRYALGAAPSVGDVIAKAPDLETWWGVLAWPLGAALAYGCLAAWNGMDDLGRRLG